MCLVGLVGFVGRSCPVSLCLIVSPAALDLYIVLKLLFNFFDSTKKKVQNILGEGYFLVCFLKHVFKFLMVDFLFSSLWLLWLSWFWWLLWPWDSSLL